MKRPKSRIGAVIIVVAFVCAASGTVVANTSAVSDDKEITVFKAIGQALSDLVAASMAYSASR